MNHKFEFKVDDKFSVSGLGMAVTGAIINGVVKPGDNLTYKRGSGEAIAVRVIQIDKFGKSNLEAATVGDEVALVLTTVTREQIAKGDILLSEN